jgi:copper(I)-binding protein
MFRRPLTIAALFVPLFLTLAAIPVFAEDLKISNVWVSQPILDEDPPAYFVVQNSASESRTIVGATSPVCESISIRRAVVSGGSESSEEVDEMEIPAGGAVAFVPRGMFLQLASPEKLEVGQIVPIELAFSNGDKIKFDATVKDE